MPGEESEIPKEPSRSEWKVMRIVWSMQKTMAREVYTVAGAQFDWSPATVKTLLKHLVDKGYLKTTQVGNGFVYRPSRDDLYELQQLIETKKNALSKSRKDQDPDANRKSSKPKKRGTR